MKKFSKLLSFILILSTLMTSFCISPAFAASQIKKGTTRIVINDVEMSNCEDVVVYNNKRYLPVRWLILVLFNNGFINYESVYKASNNSITLNFKPTGYMTFWAGSKNITFMGNSYPVLINPPVFYDKRVYISLEDLTNVLNETNDSYSPWNYGFDYKVNTVYFYY